MKTPTIIQIKKATTRSATDIQKKQHARMKQSANEAYGEGGYKDFESAFKHVEATSQKHQQEFKLILDRYPTFTTTLANTLVPRLGYRVQDLDNPQKLLTELTEEDSRLIDRALCTLVRKRKTSDVAIDSWISNYKQLNVLCQEVEGFREVRRLRKRSRYCVRAATREALALAAVSAPLLTQDTIRSS